MMLTFISLGYILVLGLSTVRGESGRDTDHLKTLHRLMTKNQLQTTFNVDHPDHVPEYDVTHPYQSTPEGNFVSHELSLSALTRREAKRSDEQHYRLKAFGETLHLNLRENKDLTVPGLMMESYVDGKVKRTPLEPSTHYFGQVRDYPESSVAISNHGALSGQISFGGQTLFIRPFPRGFFQGTADRSPHFIYKQPTTTAEHAERAWDDGHDILRSDDTDGAISQTIRTNDQNSMYYLELALTAEQAIADKYGNDTSDILLIIANNAAKAYQEPSIGKNKIKLVVTRMIIIPDDQLNSGGQGLYDMIRAIGRWARRHNPVSDRDPKHYDVIAIMRKTRGGGLASFNNICSRVVTTVFSDNGIGSWTTLAHETAHNLGVGHDPDYGCANRVNIMTTTIAPGVGWSNCSRNRFTQLFNINRYHCLKDAPQASPLPTISPSRQGKLPGTSALFDLKRQCQMWYSPIGIPCWWRDYKDCVLHCSTTNNPNSCESMFLALLDGTRCGVRNWCIKSKCVDDGSPLIHGGWSEWSGFSVCTTTCGGGIKYRERTCTNPAPQNGGDKCKGSSRDSVEVCNTQPCPPPQLRHKLCKERKGDEFSWYRYGNPCSLFCRRGNLLYGAGGLPDGTPCHPGSGKDDVCMRGTCTPVGCDRKVGSSAKIDKCGVCKGDGMSCSYERVNGSYTKQHSLKGMKNADLIVEIPSGSVNVTIKERARTKNLIGLTRMDGTFIYNVPTRPKTIKEAGTSITIRGSRGRNIGNISIPGPTTETLKAVFVYIKGKNAGIDFVFWKKKILA